MGITSSMNRTGISHISCDRTSGLYTDETSKIMVKKTNTAIAMIETFTSTFPILIGKKVGC
jgi:hypothetical protein